MKRKEEREKKRKGKRKKTEKYFKCFVYKKKRARKWLISGPAFKLLFSLLFLLIWEEINW